MRRIERINRVKLRDAAWAAALIDGEGSIGIAHSGRQNCPFVVVYNTCKPLLDELPRIFGCGRVYGITGGSRPCMTWRVGSHGAALILGVVKPHLIAKRRQAYIAIFADKLNRRPRDQRDHELLESLWLLCKKCNSAEPLNGEETELLNWAIVNRPPC